jgi:hypothetical protein
MAEGFGPFGAVGVGAQCVSGARRCFAFSWMVLFLFLQGAARYCRRGGKFFETGVDT